MKRMARQSSTTNLTSFKPNTSTHPMTYLPVCDARKATSPPCCPYSRTYNPTFGKLQIRRGPTWTPTHRIADFLLGVIIFSQRDHMSHRTLHLRHSFNLSRTCTPIIHTPAILIPFSPLIVQKQPAFQPAFPSPSPLSTPLRFCLRLSTPFFSVHHHSCTSWMYIYAKALMISTAKKEKTKKKGRRAS